MDEWQLDLSLQSLVHDASAISDEDVLEK